ncbi:hypothetical protein [uncultured Sphaerochaeta sp.]|uniref:hypothetical protein n=1 Tax=uncultured Sphaerochaeta sp. TaxID=886478 RepID=UPI002A0A1F9B|nr:hypothetical protein [uncultured Sphaerochaeta sp.]
MGLFENIREKEEEFKVLYTKYQEAETLYEQNADLASSRDRYTLTFKQLKKCVREIEILRQEYDLEIGFSSAQYITHDLVFKFKTSNKGQVKMEMLTKKARMINSILDVIHPGSEAIADFEILGISAGSGNALADYQPKSDSIEPQRVEDIQSLLCAVVQVSKEVSTEVAPPEVKFARIKEETGLDPEQGAKVLSIISNNWPTKNEEDPILGMTLGGGGSKPGKIFDFQDLKLRTKLNKTSTDLKNYLKIPESEEFSGQLRQLEEWESAHKFILFSEDGGQCTIHYEPNSHNISKIKDNIGKTVTVKRFKEGNSWFLSSWVS